MDSKFTVQVYLRAWIMFFKIYISTKGIYHVSWSVCCEQKEIRIICAVFLHHYCHRFSFRSRRIIVYAYVLCTILLIVVVCHLRTMRLIGNKLKLVIGVYLCGCYAIYHGSSCSWFKNSTCALDLVFSMFHVSINREHF